MPHPAVWHAHQLGRQGPSGWPTGFAELDAELPGGGWPAQALTELLLPHPGVGELRLLAPVLAALQRGGHGTLLFDPPAEPAAAALAALGIDVRPWIVVRGRVELRGAARERLPAADTLWALEQALHSGLAGGVLAWLPAALRIDALRRLQLAAQAHEGPAFVLRSVQARLAPSPAPLRLLLAAAGPDGLRVRLLKRRGPPLERPLMLALPPVLASALRAARLRAVAGADACLRAETARPA